MAETDTDRDFARIASGREAVMKAGAVVVAVDGSPASEAALRQAKAKARNEGWSLTGIFALDTGWADHIGNARTQVDDARKGFLDYAGSELELQIEAARAQFAAATEDFTGDTAFEVVPGDPIDTLCEIMACSNRSFSMLVAGREVFQICGRPSVKRLAHELQQCVRQPLVIV